MARLKDNSTMFFKYCWDFLHVYLPDQMGRSHHTIESYIDSLTVFKNYICSTRRYKLDTFSFTDCNTNLIFDFMKWLEMNGNAPSTINHRISGIKGYFFYATLQDVSLEFMYSKICKINPLKCKKTEKEVLNDKQIANILNQATNDTKGIRNRVMLLTLYESACRVSEIVNIKIEDLYLSRDNPYISVHGKGNKERHIPITKTLSKVLIKFISNHKEDNSQWLFTSYHNGSYLPLSTRSVQDILTRYANEARKMDSSIPNRVYPHSFRRSKATSLYQNGMALEMVSSLLGHNQIETTRIYAKPSLEQLRKEIEKSIPEEAYKQKPKWKTDKDFAKQFGLR